MKHTIKSVNSNKCECQGCEARRALGNKTAHDELLMSAMLRRDPRAILVRAREHVRGEYLRGSDVTHQVSMQVFAKFWITKFESKREKGGK